MLRGNWWKKKPFQQITCSLVSANQLSTDTDKMSVGTNCFREAATFGVEVIKMLKSESWGLVAFISTEMLHCYFCATVFNRFCGACEGFWKVVRICLNHCFFSFLFPFSSLLLPFFRIKVYIYIYFKSQCQFAVYVKESIKQKHPFRSLKSAHFFLEISWTSSSNLSWCFTQHTNIAS